MNNILSVNQNRECAGCGACAAVCPRNAISLSENSAGFYAAAVESALCVDCGVCRKVCPRLNKETSADLRRASLYAMQSAEADTVRRCSSGGIAHELARQALADGTRVVGAAYNYDTDRVEHILVDNEDGFSRLDGSKYLQSRTDSAFAEILASAKRDGKQRFLVFGTPCQIAGLHRGAVQAGVREQLTLAEIFCHGVPSYRLWEDTVARSKAKLGTARFDRVSFRYKKDDWHAYCLRLDGCGKSLYLNRETELFWQVFFENVLLNDACFSCACRREGSDADLRLGDYWGSRYQSRSDGISAVFALTERGRAAVEALQSAGAVRLLEPGTAEEMLKAQNMEGYSMEKLHREAMERLSAGEGIRTAVKYYRSRLPAKQKLKIQVLKLSGLIPDGLRARLRKLR